VLPVALQHIFVTRCYDYPKQRDVIRVITGLMGPGLLVIEGQSTMLARACTLPLMLPCRSRPQASEASSPARLLATSDQVPRACLPVRVFFPDDVECDANLRAAGITLVIFATACSIRSTLRLLRTRVPQRAKRHATLCSLMCCGPCLARRSTCSATLALATRSVSAPHAGLCCLRADAAA
jgi:hypothetical protein